MANAYTTDLLSVISLTLNRYGKKMYDQVSIGHILFYLLNKSGFKDPVDGGLQIAEQLEKELNPTIDVRNPRGAFPAQEYDPFGMVVFPWANVNGSLTVMREDTRINRGNSALANSAEKYIKNTQKAMRRKFGQLMYSDGTTSDGSPGFLGLAAVISASNTYGSLIQKDGTALAINRSLAANAWWRAQVEATVTPYAIEGALGLRHMYNNCTQDEEGEPDVICTSQLIWEAHVAMLTPNQRFQDADLAKVGFKNIAFNNASMVWDNYCPAGELDILNTEYLKLRPDSQNADEFKWGDWVGLDPDPADLKTIEWHGQLTCLNPRYLGKMTNRTVA